MACFKFYTDILLVSLHSWKEAAENRDANPLSKLWFQINQLSYKFWWKWNIWEDPDNFWVRLEQQKRHIEDIPRFKNWAWNFLDPTKIAINRIIVFDPLGLLAPFIIHGVVIFNCIWETRRRQWDSMMDKSLSNQFADWVT